MKDTTHCQGCEDNFYNGNNPLGVKQCWMLKSAKLVTRFKTGTWTQPTEKGAFTEVMVPNCYHAKGQHFYDRLPDFVKKEDVNWRKAAR